MPTTNQQMRKIIHIDMDAFFASVEQHDTPQYRGKPLIVGGSPTGRGVVAIFVRPRHERYREVSATIMDIFRKYTPLVEPLSLDEAFLDVTSNKENEPSATLLAQRIRKEIFTTTGLTASAGVSFNKFIAKIASDINKPNGITVIPPERATEFIATLPIGNFFGVGRVTEKKMLFLGIKTGEDLLRWSRSDLCFHFGKAGDFLYHIARGQDFRPVQPKRGRKSVGSETTMENDIDDYQQIITILQQISAKVGAVLQQKKLLGFTLVLKVRFADFATVTRSITTRKAFTSEQEINMMLPRLLAATPLQGKKIRLLGITVSKLEKSSQRPQQLTLPFLQLL